VRTTSHTLDLDDVGPVEHAGLRAWALSWLTHDVLRTDHHGLVIGRKGVPSLTQNGRPAPPGHGRRARSEGLF
jgi:hypothetical protein